MKSNTHDPADAAAIWEAVTRPTMRFVPIKEVEQPDLQSRHRARERVVKVRTARVNAMRGFRAEYGLVLPHSGTKFRHAFLATLEAERAKLTPWSPALLGQLSEDCGVREKRRAYSTDKSAAIGAAPPVCQRLLTIPGSGPRTATALVAAVSNASAFKHGRQCAAWSGRVPRHPATGGKPRLLGISTRGDVYLRTLVIHGARATRRGLRLKTERRSPWLRGRRDRRGTHKAAVALANKQARIAWVLLPTDQVYIAAQAAASRGAAPAMAGLSTRCEGHLSREDMRGQTRFLRL